MVILVLRPVVRVSEVRLEGELGVRASAKSGASCRRRRPSRSTRRKSCRASSGSRTSIATAATSMPRCGCSSPPMNAPSAPWSPTASQSGPRSRLADVQFTGALDPFQKPELIARLGLKPGDAYSRRTIRDSAERLQTWLIQKGYRTARVDAPSREDRRGEEHRHPHLSCRQSGRWSYPESHRRRGAAAPQTRPAAVPRRPGFRRGADPASHAAAQGRLPAQGYYKVRIDWDQKRPRTISSWSCHRPRDAIHPAPGHLHRQQDSISSDRLAPLMATASRSLLNLGSGRLVDTQLKADLENIWLVLRPAGLLPRRRWGRRGSRKAAMSSAW